MNAATIEDVAANCDDGSSTNLQRDESNVIANNLSNDKQVAMAEDSVDEVPKTDKIECDVDESLKVNDFGVDKETAITVNDTEMQLCNGNAEENPIQNDSGDDNSSNIDIPTSNGETLTENMDSGENDVNFDQIFDNLPENSTNSDGNNVMPAENDEQAIENVPEISENPATVAEADECQSAEGIEHIEDDKSPVEADGTNDAVVKVNDVSLEMSPEAEEELLKSPSMQEHCINVSTEYSESMLLKDDSKVGTTIVDEADSLPSSIGAIPKATSATTPSNEPLISDSLFDQLKAAEMIEESMQKASKQPDASGQVDQEKCESAAKSTDTISLEIDNDSNSSNSKDPISSPAQQIDESMDVTDNKENNLLEAMAGSPASVDHCMEGGSMSSVRDVDDNGFANSVIDLKDGNSNDARDGFDDNDDKISVSSGQEILDQTSISNDDKINSKCPSNISRSNEGSSTGFVNESMLELQDSIESSGAKLFDGDDDGDIVDTPDKSSESVIAIDDDDDSSAVILTSDEPRADLHDEPKGNEEPPAKRMRIDSNEASTDETNATEAVAVSVSSAIIESDTKADSVTTSEPNGDVSIGNETDKNLANIDDDDDDLVIVETNECEQSLTTTDTASNTPNSNKRPASPSPIDTTDETRKKHKSDEDDATVVATTTVSDPTASNPTETAIKPDEENDTIESEAAKVDFDALKHSKEEPAEKKVADDHSPKSPKIEDDSTPVQMKDMTTEKNVELKLELKPEPEKCEKRSIALDFAAKFKKSLAQMSRKNLEEFVLVKITEAIVHKSEFSELKQKSDVQEQMIQASRVKLQEIGKQYRDLEMVYARLKKDLENKNQIIVSPIKITRAVGLQVSIQKDGAKAPPQKQPAQSNGVVTYSTNAANVRTVIRADQATASMANAQHQRLSSAMAPNALKQITHIQRQPIRPGTTIRQVVQPEQPRLTAGTKFCILA